MMSRFFALMLGLLVTVPAQSVEQLGYRVVDKKPSERRNFVQGLEILDGKLYVSTGHYGQSRLMRYNFDDMALEVEQRLHPRLFGEGLTILGDHIYQLTWRAGLMLVFDKSSMKLLNTMPVAGQGWGLTNDGERLIYTNGTEYLHFLERNSPDIERSLRVTENGIPVTKLNELEWIDGRIWANIWQSDRVVIIDPTSGEVLSSIDLSGLLPAVERQPDTDVLNGIARDPADDTIWVTGKRWPWLYQIELIPETETPMHDKLN